MKSFLFLTLLAIAAGSRPAPAEVTVRDADWVRQRVARWQPTTAEKRWESIGWAAGLGDALRLAKKTYRPVFLFTLDGKMNVGRC
jgi:hypothetical protein